MNECSVSTLELDSYLYFYLLLINSSTQKKMILQNVGQYIYVYRDTALCLLPIGFQPASLVLL